MPIYIFSETCPRTIVMSEGDSMVLRHPGLKMIYKWSKCSWRFSSSPVGFFSIKLSSVVLKIHNSMTIGIGAVEADGNSVFVIENVKSQSREFILHTSRTWILWHCAECGTSLDDEFVFQVNRSVKSTFAL